MIIKGFILAILAFIGYVYFRYESKYRTFSLFNLNVSDYELIGCDINRHSIKFDLSSDGCFGTPDCVFRNRKTKNIVIGEYKSRNYRGLVKLREYYQVMLYMGLAKQRFPGYEIIGRIRYANTAIDIEFSSEVYDALLGLKSEAERAVEKKSGGFLSKVLGRKDGGQPLHIRKQLRLPKYVMTSFAD